MQVPAVGEIANVLSSKTMKVQISFVDGSNKWLVRKFCFSCCFCQVDLFMQGTAVGKAGREIAQQSCEVGQLKFAIASFMMHVRMIRWIDYQKKLSPDADRCPWLCCKEC